MRVTAELREVRRQMAIDFFRTVSSKDFKAEPGPFGIGFSHPLLQQLQHLCMHFPPNITYLTDGSGLDIVEPDKLKPHAQEVDMGKILASCPKAEVVLFGEDHVRNINAHRFIRGSIQALGAEGFKAYGVELLNVADTDLVGAFNKGGDRERTALKSHIEDSWNTGFMAAAADTHMEIFDAAKEAGITVYPMTHPRIWDHLTVAPSFPFGVRLGEEPRARDCFMSLAANHALVEIGKSVVLAGRGHIDVNNGLPSVLRLGFGYESISVALVEREDVTDPFMVKYTSEIRRIVPAWRTLNWNVNDAPPQEADWLVFFPHAPRSEA